MANKHKAKGTRHESTVTRALRAFGLQVIKPRQEGRRDIGDMHLSPFVLQAKDWTSWQDAIREGLDGAEVQVKNAGEQYGVAVVKRARRKVGEAYAVMTLATFARVVRRLLRAEALLAETRPEAYRMHAEETAAELAEPFPSGNERD